MQETSELNLKSTNKSKDLVRSKLTYKGNFDESSDSGFILNQLGAGEAW
ncbi:4023_t:CDS:2 [Scutellospora calospora]|uniref:4023_t:CDS:1 n=1 Tax=Scutellospora calospora TaxID=85575 RepID=A0ACA9JUE2_9GLOM|nr:4023_t:CDS:2 [Scutellospora calospora]